MKICKKIISLSLVISLFFSSTPLYADWKRWAIPVAFIVTSAASQVAAQSDCDCSPETNYTDPNVVTGYALAFVAVAGCVWGGFTGAVVWMCSRCNDNCTGETGLERGAYCHNLACGCFRGYKDSDWKRRAEQNKEDFLFEIVKSLIQKKQYNAASTVIELAEPKDRELIKDRIFNKVAKEATSAEQGAKGKFTQFKEWFSRKRQTEPKADEENQLGSLHVLASSGEDAEYEASEEGSDISNEAWAVAVSGSDLTGNDDPANEDADGIGQKEPPRGLGNHHNVDSEEK